MTQPSNFTEFWPEYLSAHRDPRTRATHYVGTSLGVICVLVFFATLDWHWLVAAPICGYGFAFASHYIFEHNHPKTFEHPVWSFMSDFYMLGRFLTGTLKPEIAKLPARA
jgi:hypothetical protein